MDQAVNGGRSGVKGWGIDADPRNDPTYPLKKRTDGEHAGYSWERPAQQPVNVEILHSIERPNVTAVFGTSVPPSGLSGVIRRLAFRHSESSYAHWLPLILADRINMIEGILDDLRGGRFPNLARERGWKAAWRFDRWHWILGLLTRVLLFAAALALLILLFD